jgi:hypothetical protein
MSGSWTNPNAPNLTDFSSWVYGSMGVPTAALPTGSVWLEYAFNQAIALVAFYPTVTPIEYVLAVYNCGGHILLKITPDQPGQSFFAQARSSMKLAEPEIGIIQSSGDESTSNSFAIGEGMRNMTLGDLNFYRTPYGREFLAYSQDAGPSIWGLT